MSQISGYCQCGHNSKDHRYSPEALNGYRFCIICNCSKFRKQTRIMIGSKITKEEIIYEFIKENEGKTYKEIADGLGFKYQTTSLIIRQMNHKLYMVGRGTINDPYRIYIENPYKHRLHRIITKGGNHTQAGNPFSS